MTTPPSLAFTRHVQREADRFGLEITQYNYSAANAFVKLQTDALAVPRPGLLNILWRQTHPPLGDASISRTNTTRGVKARRCSTGTASSRGTWPPFRS